MSLDRRQRTAFQRASSTYDDSAVLAREVAGRMVERLAWVRVTPDSIVDAGCATGADIPLLHARYPRASVIALDVSPAMLSWNRGRSQAGNWLDKLRALGRAWSHTGAGRVAKVCGDFTRMPLGPASVDMVWSNLALHWSVDLGATLREWRRVLRPGGLLMFSTYGPDTLKELRAAFDGLDRYQHVNRFMDMHDIGDMLMTSGFSNPVMEMDYLTLTYANARALCMDLKHQGEQTVLDGRRAGLMGRGTWRRMLENYESRRHDGRLPATFEVVYGHAWAGAPARAAGEGQVIRMHRHGPKGGG
jgi:malonyl-CoA O-methyltransferase